MKSPQRRNWQVAHCNRTTDKVPKASILGGFLDLVKREGVFGVVFSLFYNFLSFSTLWATLSFLN
jgi:hypothetical protein